MWIYTMSRLSLIRLIRLPASMRAAFFGRKVYPHPCKPTARGKQSPAASELKRCIFVPTSPLVDAEAETERARARVRLAALQM